MIQFLLNDKPISIENERADTTVLHFLREKLALSGTKEGCASGDCGACTVVLAEPSTNQDNTLTYQAINSCVTFLPALHGKQLITVEHLSESTTPNKASSLHPVQQAMVDANASQCGFCTPGFVMSMFALYKQGAEVDRNKVITALSGNLCRCTGYKPIIEAAITACDSPGADQFTAAIPSTLKQLSNIQTMQAGTSNLIMPVDRKSLASALQNHTDAVLVAGSTDLALVHTQQLKSIKKMITLRSVSELTQINLNENMLKIGAACTLSELQESLLTHFPTLKEVIERFASVPIRNQATLGGNIANASPIGDLPPTLIALNAELVLDNGQDYRRMPLKDFFIDYKKTHLQTNEWVHSVEIPRLTAEQKVRVYKVSKRIEDDISAVCMALNISLENGCVVSLMSGFGGVAAIPTSCSLLNDSLIGMKWSSTDALQKGKTILAEAFEPLDDVRASANYRVQLLQNLWHRFWLESNHQAQKIATRVHNHA